jgi:hypothetical protein
MSPGFKVSLYWILGLFVAFTLLALRGRSQSKQAEETKALLQTVHGYTDVVEGYGRIAKDPQTSGVAAVICANELTKTQPPETSIAYFNGLLSKVSDASVKRAIRFQLVDLYRKAGQRDKAMEQLEILMVMDPKN